MSRLSVSQGGFGGLGSFSHNASSKAEILPASHGSLAPMRSVSQATLPPAVSIGSPTFGLPSLGHIQSQHTQQSLLSMLAHATGGGFSSLQQQQQQQQAASVHHQGSSHAGHNQFISHHSQPMQHAATIHVPGGIPQANRHLQTVNHFSNAHSLPPPPLPPPASTYADVHHASHNHSQLSIHSQVPHIAANDSTIIQSIRSHGPQSFSQHPAPPQTQPPPTVPPTAGYGSALPSTRREPPNFSNFANDASFHAAYSGPDLPYNSASQYGQRRGDGVEIVDAATFFANPASDRAPRSVPRTGLDCVEQPDCVFELLHPELEYGYEMGSALPPRRAERLDDVSQQWGGFQAPLRQPGPAFGGAWNSDWVAATTRAILMAEAPLRNSNAIPSPGPFQFYETAGRPLNPVAIFR